MCEVSQSLIMKCDLPFTCQDVFDGYIGQEHESRDCTCLHHLSHFPFRMCVWGSLMCESLICVHVSGRRARWLMPPQTWTTRKPSASSTTTTDRLARGSGRRSVPAPSCSSAPASRPWQVRGHNTHSVSHGQRHLHQ